MNVTLRRLCLAVICLLLPALAHAQNWIAPTPEELKMTSEAQAPGARAIYLNREEITDDHLHIWRKYARIKVLTEGGKDLANVEVRQFNDTELGDGFKVVAIAGRTIHPDGTIIPFTGTPMEKLLEKSQGYKVTAKVFTLPAVEVGSIIEYRYELGWDDNLFIPPTWIIQSDLFTRHAHYVWLPTGEQLISRDEKGEQVTSGISWTSILPRPTDLKMTELPVASMNGPGTDGKQRKFEVTLDSVPAQAHEEYMPPVRSLGLRVRFFYTPYNNQAQFWKEAGNRWSKTRDRFIGPGSNVQAAVQQLVAAGDTDEQKLRKIYAAVQKLDNTQYSRQRSAAEEHAQGLGEVKNADDIWQRKRGNGDQLTALFVSMARAAGMKAYLMTVTSRDNNIFVPAYMSMSQLDDDIAIVNVGGKEQFFDPGQPMNPYGQLAWKHTLVQGVRQLEGGASAIATSPFSSYTESRTDRLADLAMDERGVASGLVKMTYRGAPALDWRHQFLRGDDTSLRHDLEESIQRMLPGNVEVKVQSIENLQEYEQPLVVSFNVKGTIATSTGKRMIVPGDVFESASKPTFTLATRAQAVYFPYPYYTLDAVRVKFPAGLAIEASPQPAQIPLNTPDADNKTSTAAMYQYKTETTPNSVTVHRNLMMGESLFLPSTYPALHAFFTNLETQDHQPTVLTLANQSASN